MKQTDSGIYINQVKYARSLVKRFGLEKATHARTPMAVNAKLTNDPLGESVNVTLYRSMIGCLLYLTTSCPDIAFSVGVCSRFQSNPKISHLIAIKRIIKYVSGTCDYGLIYSKESNLSKFKQPPIVLPWKKNVHFRLEFQHVARVISYSPIVYTI